MSNFDPIEELPEDVDMDHPDPASDIGNCSSNECQIRGRCTYPTACRKITDDRPSIAALQDMLARTTTRVWYPRGRFISLVPDNTGMGATLPTNHIANFADPDDASGVCAMVNSWFVLLEIAAAALLMRETEDALAIEEDDLERHSELACDALHKFHLSLAKVRP